MKFKVKDVDIATGDALVVLLNEQDARLLDLKHEDRIKLTYLNKKVIAVLDISQSRTRLKSREIGLFEEALAALGVKNGDIIDVELTPKPESISFIREKLHGEELTYQKIHQIIKDIVDGRLTAIEKTYFVSASYAQGLSIAEIVNLTKAIVNTGETLNFKGRVFDKHCIGGIPGNRTTMIVVPIVAAAGLTMPKTSSRAITSPAGTADTMEVLANVILPIEKLRKVVDQTNACIVWGGAMNLAPADDKIIEVEHPLSLDVEGQMLASVMAKKASVGATHVLIDIPYGKNAKCKTLPHANHLKKMFILLGNKLRMKTKVILTNGNGPIGRGIGPALEARDVLWVLQNNERAPSDLKEKSIRLAGMILETAGIKNGLKTAQSLLESGEAWQKMRQIITAQGERPKAKPGRFVIEIKSQKTGKVQQISNLAIERIARAAGAPDNKGAGLYLYKRTGDAVKKGEPLYAIHTESAIKMNFAWEVAKQNQPFLVR